MQMTYEKAKYQLQLHTGVIDTAYRSMILEDGFLTSLRPYRGLQEKNVHLVLEALLTVGERIHRDSQVDRELVTTIWSMCWYARLWGLHPQGMLQSNNLITTEDSARLKLWIDTVEQTALSLLGGQAPHHAVHHYAQYIVEVGWWDNIPYFISLMDRALSDTEIYGGIEIILSALGKLGGLASAVLPTLREARERTYYGGARSELANSTTVNRETEIVRANILKVIQAIEHADEVG